MAGGSKLKYGEYTVERLSQSDMYDVINSILSPTASRSSSYKFIFFKAENRISVFCFPVLNPNLFFHTKKHRTY